MTMMNSSAARVDEKYKEMTTIMEMQNENVGA